MSSTPRKLAIHFKIYWRNGVPVEPRRGVSERSYRDYRITPARPVATVWGMYSDSRRRRVAGNYLLGVKPFVKLALSIIGSRTESIARQHLACCLDRLVNGQTAEA